MARLKPVLSCLSAIKRIPEINPAIPYPPSGKVHELPIFCK